jgi:hypothetical protein
VSFYSVSVHSEEYDTSDTKTFETDNETLECVLYVIEMIQSLDNDEKIVITADIF